MTWNPLLGAALDAADRGWHVFPLVRAGKVPALRNWEQRATTGKRQIYRWWAHAEANVGVATGRSGLVVIDLDDGRGAAPPERFVGARNGRDVLAILAAEAGAPVPTDTYEVATPSGGSHMYFRSPPGVVLRNTAGSLGWKVDSRSVGGYCVAAGSIRGDGVYRVVRRGEVAELPDWLARALTPPPPPAPGPPMVLSAERASAYVRAIVESEARAVVAARTGTRHRVLLKAARTLGRLVGGGELDDQDARAALFEAGSSHIGIDGCTVDEVCRTIEGGVEFGRRLPRRIAGNPVRTSFSSPARPAPGPGPRPSV
ncbi:bifunctional DNA primase/polymerase [Pseudonocardia saturnea]